MAIHLGNNKTYDRKPYTIPAESVYTIDFNGMTANFFRVNNMSEVTLYCATQSYPNKNLYDFKAPPHSVANFTEPAERNKLYIYNDTKSDAKIILTSWADEFDPTFMAVSEITLNTEGVVETDGITKGFTCSLPSGSNNIGKVTIANPGDIGGNDYSSDIALIRNGTNNIAGQLVELNSETNNIKDKTDLLTYINEDIIGIKDKVVVLENAHSAIIEEMIDIRTKVREIVDNTSKMINGNTDNTNIRTKLTCVTMGNLGTEVISAERFGFRGYKPNKIIVTLPDSKEKIHVEVPCIHENGGETVFIPWYYFEELTEKLDTFTIQADQINSTEVIIEFVTDKPYDIVTELNIGDVFMGVTMLDKTVYDNSIYILDENGDKINIGQIISTVPAIPPAVYDSNDTLIGYAEYFLKGC